MRRPLLLASALLLVLTSSAFAREPLTWPEVRPETKPWSRWWWLGNIADEKTLTSEMERYAAAGLGGLEITPIYGVRGYEDRFVPFLSPRWVELFNHTLAEARRLDLGIDLATGTGWPFGGPWISDTDAAHTLAHRRFTLDAGAQLAEPVTFTQPGLVRTAGPRRVALAELRQPVTANANLQDLALDQVRFAQPLPLVVLMAFPSGSARADRPLPPPIDLTTRVDAGGQLDWSAPAKGAPWTLYALFQGQHGKLVERAAPGGEGYAIDHLSPDALKNYLAKFDAALAQCHIMYDNRRGGFRAFFNDSYEVDDAEGEANFTPQFLAEFQRRRGYDLRQHLPELFGDSGTSGVLSDYRETVSDLLLDAFTKPWRAWAAARGALIRNQAHNSPAHVLDLYAASDIPEQEGSNLLAMKLASSAAHLTGKPLASSETATWLNEHWLTTLAELKQNVDTYLLAGLNHNCYHGTAFSPPDDPWPGFQFYASVELSPANPLWADFSALNAYVTRAQSFLQSGQPDEDVLLYYNIHDRWARRGDGRLPHFGHGGRDAVGVTAATTAAALRDAGLGFDYVSDRLLQNVTVDGATLRSAHARYRALVVPATTFMPEATLARLVQLAEAGAAVLVVGQLPQSAPGLHPRDTAFTDLLARIRKNATEQNGVTVAKLGAGEIVIGTDLPALLAHRRDLPRETLRGRGLDFVRRRTADGHVYFLANRTDRPLAGWVTLQAPAAAAALFDPMTGQAGLAALRPGQSPLAGDSAVTSDVYLQLAPGASLIIQLHASPLAAPAWTYHRPAAAAPLALSGPWSVTFTSGGPTLPPPAQIPTLSSWTEFAGEPGRAFSGTARYSTTFAAPARAADAWELDLGTVADSARVSLNGHEIATLIQPPWRVVLPADLLREHNTLEIAVTNLGANRIADLDRRGVSWKKFYNANMPARLRENAGPDRLFTAAHWTPRNSGLLGPVMLAPLARFNPAP